jgi:hypothetical protein
MNLYGVIVTQCDYEVLQALVQVSLIQPVDVSDNDSLSIISCRHYHANSDLEEVVETQFCILLSHTRSMRKYCDGERNTSRDFGRFTSFWQP